MEALDTLLTMRVKSWTTSDIGGLNSGSCCIKFKVSHTAYLHVKRTSDVGINCFYLNAAANNVSETG